MRYILCLLFLCLPSLAFGQRFNNVVDSSQYPAIAVGVSIPINPGFALLKYRTVPRGSYTDIVDASIIPSYTFRAGDSYGNAGWYSPYGEVGAVGSYTDIYVVIDSATIYSRSGPLNNRTLNTVQEILISKNLGTVQQRAAYIAGFSVKPPPIVSPGDILGTFTKMLGPWAYALVGMMIALLALDIGSSKMKKVAGEAAKLERSARRTEINRQIKNDQTARVYQRKLRNMSHFLYTYTDRDDFYKDVRKRFKQTSIDYAEYKASKGWIL